MNNIMESGALENLLTCPISFDRYQANGKFSPLQLFCGHTMCLDCIKKLETKTDSGYSISCPECRQETKTTLNLESKLHPNYTLISIITHQVQQQNDPKNIQKVLDLLNEPQPGVKLLIDILKTYYRNRDVTLLTLFAMNRSIGDYIFPIGCESVKTLLLVLKFYQTNPSISQTVCEVLFRCSKNSETSRLIIKYDGVELLFGLFNEYKSNTKFVEEILTGLLLICDYFENHIIFSGAFRILFDLINQYKDNVSIVNVGIHLLLKIAMNQLCKNKTCKNKHFQQMVGICEDDSELIIQMMQQYNSNVDIVKTALVLIEELVPTYKPAIRNHINLFVTLSNQHIAQPEIVVKMTQIFVLLLSDDYDDMDSMDLDSEKQFTDHNGPNTVISMIKHYQDDSERLKCLFLLFSIINVNSGGEIIRSCRDNIFYIMDKYPTDFKLMGMVCSNLLLGIEYVDDVDDFFAQNRSQTLLNLISTQPKVDTFVYLHFTLWSIIFNDAEEDDDIDENYLIRLGVDTLNGVSFLTQKIKEFSNNRSIVKVGCKILLKCINTKEYKLEFIRLGGLDILLEIIDRHGYIANIMILVCKALWVLATNQDNKNYIAQKNGAEILLKVINHHQSNADLVKTACGVLWSIGASSLIQNSEAITVLLSIIYQYSSNQSVLTQARGALSQIM